MNEPIRYENLKDRIIEIRGQKVLLDSDVADIYGVETRDINKAVINNRDKFPAGYVVELLKPEKNELVENFHRFNKLKHSTVNPKAFPEKGLYMLATILKSPQAVQATLAVIETFTKIKQLSRNIRELSSIQDKDRQKSLLQEGGKLIEDVFGEDMETSGTETSIEINFAVVKFKHSVQKKKKRA
ncbi:MAG: DNA-binding protein [Deltaproteobacteria bacterium HGW-Deltaproteobacteria-1]|nr:MAG: DNA-binding protein [Deltaproteobacteria bacterium HGW-Deltaproteobacteria-1]